MVGCGGGSLFAASPPEVAVSAGTVSVFDHTQAFEGGLELRGAGHRLHFLPHWIAGVAPMAGVLANGRGARYGYAGFRLEVPVGGGWSASPSFAAGVYHEGRLEGDVRRLGGPVEFRSAIELGHELSQRARLGLTLYHLSNAGLYEHNPGVESLVLTFTWRARAGS
jgi:hypothetical protein